jgi:hypothetical protein
MTFDTLRGLVVFPIVASCLLTGSVLSAARAQGPGGSPQTGSTRTQSSSSQPVPQEKAPSLIDPAGPTISLVPSESVFLMAAALNACGYDEGLEELADPAAGARRDEPGAGQE